MAGATTARRPRLPQPVWSHLAWLLLAVAIVPLLAGPVWAATHHWTPESDDAIVALRAHDTFSGSPPVVGMPSTLGQANTNTGASHPGPLEFWVLAIPYALSGWSPIGLLIGITIVNLAAVAAIAWMAHRRGGSPLVALAAVGIGLLCWGVGSEAIRSLWNPYIVLLPFVALVAAVAALADDDPVGLPIAAATASFVVQTHLSYVGLVGLLVAWAAVLGVAMTRSARRRSTPVGAPPSGGMRRTWTLTAIVVIACWIVPVVQQFVGHPGNLSAVVRGLFDSGHNATAGAAGGVVAMGRVVGWPIAGLSPVGAQVWTQPALGASAIVRWLCPWLVTAGAAIVAVRRRDWRTVRVLATVGVLLVATFVTAWRVGTPSHLLYTYYVAWLWPGAVLVWSLLAVSIWRLAAPAVSRRTGLAARRAVGLVVAALLVIVAVLLPRPAGPADQVRFRRVVHDLAAPVVAATPHGGQVIVVALGSVPFLSTRAGLMAVLEQHGRHARTSLGFGRKVFPMGAPHNDHGEPADATIWLTTGTAGSPDASARKLATVEALDPQDRRDLRALGDRLRRSITRHRIHLTPQGTNLLREQPHSARAASLRAALRDPVASLEQRQLLALADLDLVTLPGPLRPYETYTALSQLAGPDGRITAWVSPGRPPGRLRG